MCHTETQSAQSFFSSIISERRGAWVLRTAQTEAQRLRLGILLGLSQAFIIILMSHRDTECTEIFMTCKREARCLGASHCADRDTEAALGYIAGLELSIYYFNVTQRHRVHRVFSSLISERHDAWVLRTAQTEAQRLRLGMLLQRF